MSNKIIQFNKSVEEEECECPSCDLAHEYLEYCKLADTEEELFNVLRELISDAGDLELRNYLQQEIVAKTEILDDLTYSTCECEECDCEE
jgi:hypothetical protein